MDVWRILLYVIAGVLALKSLAGLMTIHRQNYFQRELAEEKRKIRAAKKAAASQAAAHEQVAVDSDQSVPGKNGSKSPTRTPVGRS